MSRIPLYDATAPVACTIDETDVAERLAQVERLRAAVTEVERTAAGLVLRFPVDPAVEADVRRFAEDEKRCCAFWGFAAALIGRPNASIPDELAPDFGVRAPKSGARTGRSAAAALAARRRRRRRRCQS